MEVWSGRRHPLVPPKRYGGINIGDPMQISNEFFKYFLEKGQVKPHYKILEVGSGFGRMAIPFTTYLNLKGSYDGLEILTDGYNWCNSHFTPIYPNFQFHNIDVYNKRYNPTGSQNAVNYKFPFDKERFDFVWLTSVFTHMFWEEIENYLLEIYRVLKPRGKSCITWYLMDDMAKELIDRNMGTYNFKFRYNDDWIETQEDPLFQIAFLQEKVVALYNHIGFKGVTIQKGKWSGCEDGLSFQDIIWAEK